MPSDTGNSINYRTPFGSATIPFVQTNQPVTGWISYTGYPPDIEKLTQAINRLAQAIEKQNAKPKRKRNGR